MPVGWSRTLATVSATVAALVTPSSTWADATDQDTALALTLFDEGRALLAAGKIPEACARLSESRRLDPLPGTVLNLAVCRERQGLTASAVVEFRQARAMAERDHRSDRVAFADEHLRALEPRVSNLVIVVGPAADLPALGVTRDGSPVARIAWGSRIPVDPGEHVVEASAPGKRPWKQVVKVSPGGDVQRVVLTPLEDVAPTPAPSAPEAPGLLQAQGPQPSARDAGQGGLSTRRAFALASTGVGLVGMAVGGIVGLAAKSQFDKAQQETGDPRYTDSASAFHAGNVATVLMSVGGLLAADGVVLWLTAPSQSTQLGANGSQVFVKGSFQ